MALKTSDSLSRCDPNLYSNIYDVRSHPDVRPSPFVSKDTISFSTDKIKEEAQNYLKRTTKVMIPYDSFMRIGKYLFLSIAFPPYLVVYGLPKWIIIEGLPALFSMGSWFLNKIQQKVSQPLEQGMRKIEQLLRYFQKISQVLILPINRLLIDFGQVLKRLFHPAKEFFKELNEKIKKGFQSFGEKLKLKPKFSQIKEFFTQGLHSEKLQEGILWIKEKVFLGMSQVQNLKNFIVSHSTPLLKRVHFSQNMAERATHWISKQFEKGRSKIKQSFQPLVNFYKKSLLPPWNKLKMALQGKWKGAGEFFKRALRFLQGKQEKLKNLSSHQWLSQKWLSGKWAKKWLSIPLIKAILEWAFKSYSVVAKLAISGAIYLMQGVFQGLNFISKITLSLRKTASLLYQKISKIFEFISIVCSKFTLSLLYYLIFSGFIFSTLLIWGIGSSVHVLNQMIGRISFLKAIKN